MKRQELLELLTKLDMQPSKKLGQNFLLDNNLIDLIVRSAKLKDNDNVLEIGPGTGHLTEIILKHNVSLTAIEYDLRLAEYLTDHFKDKENFKLIQADAGRVHFDELVGDKPWICLANLPYAVSTVILGRLLEIQNPPERMILLLQKEMADRIAAQPGIKNYGSLSVRVQSFFEAKVIRKVPPDVFCPRPDVDSAILGLERRDYIISVEERKKLFPIIKLAFSQRRKKMIKVLKSQYKEDKLIDAFKALNIDLNARAENLTVKQYLKLAELI